MAFDSLYHYSALRETGVPEEQARVYIEILIEISWAENADVIDTSIFYNKLMQLGCPRPRSSPISGASKMVSLRNSA